MLDEIKEKERKESEIYSSIIFLKILLFYNIYKKFLKILVITPKFL